MTVSCTSCEYTKQVLNYRMKGTASGIIYVDNNNADLTKCPECGGQCDCNTDHEGLATMRAGDDSGSGGNLCR